LLGIFLYLPNVAANISSAVIFGLAILRNILVSIRQKTWGYMVGMMLGLLCEVIGYVGRILLSENDFIIVCIYYYGAATLTMMQTPFYLYIICLTIGPAFLSFSIYTCLARVIIVYGRTVSRFEPKPYTYVFAVSDFISLVLQGAGGGIAATAGDATTSQQGINILIAGLALQVFSLSIFIGICVELAFRIRRHGSELDFSYETFRQSRRFRTFLWALGVATVAIYIRSVFRVAELQQGFQSRFANNEITFMVLEGGMIVVATIALTALHPGLVCLVVFGGRFPNKSKDVILLRLRLE
jgi:RTA1 like protein